MNRLVLISLFLACLNLPAAGQDYKARRQQMVKQQIIDRGIDDPQVIGAMKAVKRHEFVPKQVKSKAYSDNPLPIGHGQTISQPYIVALMTELLELKEGEKVLEIGTGSGYQAAILANIVSEIYTIEIVEALGKKARQTLNEQGYNNVHVKIGDGFKGWPEHAPFDAIIVTASPSDIPRPLKKQLAEGGRMIVPVGGTFLQKLVLLKKKNGKLKKQDISSVRFVPMVDEDGTRY